MTDSQDDRRPLIPPKKPRGGVYGATRDDSFDVERDLPTDGSVTPVDSCSDDGQGKDVDSVKQGQKFRDIWVLCLGLFSATFCSALGATVVSNLQIEIGSYFRAGSVASWLGTAYLLGLTAMTPLYGRFCTVFGQKRTMLLALGLFFVGTLACAVAPSMLFILVARAIAGAGAGGIMTVTAIIISDLVSLADRGLYQGMVNVLFGSGAASGAVIGGALADKYGWRMAFWIQVPPLLIAAFLIVLKVHVKHHRGEDSTWTKFKRIDWAGSFVLMSSISSLSIGASLTTTSGYPLTHPLVSGLFLLSLSTLPLFVWIERRAKEPILPLSVLSRFQPRIVLIAFMLTTMTNFSRMFMQPVYLHVSRGLNGRETGLLLLPGSIFGSATSLYAGWHMRRFKEYKWFVVSVSVIPSLQALSIMTNWGIDTNVHRLWVEMTIGQMGGGAVLTALLVALIAVVDKSELSLAIAAAYLFRAIGQVIGVAIAASIQQSILSTQLLRRLQDQPADLIRAIIQEPATVIPGLEPTVKLQARMAYLRSVEGVFGFVTATGICLTMACLCIRAKRL
ncbi:major facilitator superfamily domain-containing protein [Papiliotrema laurentii]|uniref:Major facilitator superfamily domain-containing protein n=1 Tax=Papiliotrema laurentii TaxID=5418 RepID=A0AAD9CV13_PAPLA|nr:major facilitator superfamily domain-containing protein [Papiliotrema laurentii]